MANIVPISELSTDPERISRLCHALEEPVFLTKDGYGDLVVMSIEQYEQLSTRALSTAAKQKMGYAPGPDAAPPKAPPPAEEAREEGIKKLPLEDVADILKEELKRQRLFESTNRNRFP